MISVAEALERILAGVSTLPSETVSLGHAVGRVLAADVSARVTQPPVDISAMDGYAVRAADIARVPVKLRAIGEAPAGGAFEGRIGPGEAVRIFTGGPVPEGADTIIIQEDVETDGEQINVREGVAPGTHVRPAGLDFRAGDVGVAAGRSLTPRDIGLAAAMNVPWLDVRRKPRIALLATGNEIVRPGESIGRNQIVSSNALALAALIASNGGESFDLGIALDTPQSLQSMVQGARGGDMLVTMGGASVGDHDLVHSVLGGEGLEIDFWKIAMRPGKPLMFGNINGTPMLGLPGNPVSSLVCGLIFLVPAIRAMLGLANPQQHARLRAVLGCALEANDRREDYLRARLTRNGEDNLVATPFAKQDSSMLSLLAQSECLVVRPPCAPSAGAGETVEIIPLAAPDTLI